MQIKDVEKHTGLTKRSIKLYEEKGLLKPEKNEENGYRDYIETDVECLKKIKMYRSLEFSLDEIKLILISSDKKEEIYNSHLKEIELKINRDQMARCFTMQLKDDEIIEDTDSVKNFMEEISENSKDTYWNPHINLSELPLWTALFGVIVASFIPSYFFTWYIILGLTILTVPFTTVYSILKKENNIDNSMTKNITKTFAIALGLLDYEFLFYKLFNIEVDACIKRLGEQVTIVTSMQLLGLGLVAIIACMLPLALYVLHLKKKSNRNE